MYQIRTDLALETQEKMQEDKVDLKGVRYFEEEVDKNLVISTVVIETENGAKTMGKPKGTYITIEAGNMDEEDEDYHREISEQLANVIQKLVPVKKEELSVLVVGLGNRAVTPDSLGPRVVDNLCITRHILKEYGRFAFGKEGMNRISSIVPGVMAQTGMETSEIVKGIVDEIKPDFVIAIDALAARNTKRLNRTIQVADTGINPGSGVGNHRAGITKETLGIPVIAIGVPTVVDAATIVRDTMESMMDNMENIEPAEKYEALNQMIAPHLYGMFVTPKDIDETIARLGLLISEALNILFAENIGEAKIDVEA